MQVTTLGPRWPHSSRGLPLALACERGGASAVLAARLSSDDVAAVEEAIASNPETHALYFGASPVERQRLRLSLGVHLGVEEVARQARLIVGQPPEDVHAMARGPMAAAGGLYEADLVSDALAAVGVDIASLRSGLDFGCSSGRVLRVLASAYPDVSWHGCDPNGPAIAWARDAIPTASFFPSGDRPPLELPDGSLDLVYAISIWSHFAPELGLAWFDEMHRLLRPGAMLVATTHGVATLDHDALHGLRTQEQLDEISDALVKDGCWYHAEFGDVGDWGVVNPDWGTAFVSAEWMLANLNPHWHVLEFAPGRNAGNQDVYVLMRA